MKRFLPALILILLAIAPVNAQFAIRQAFPSLTFTAPVDLVSPDDNSKRIFVVSQAGRIFVFPNSVGVTQAKTFLDIADRVIYSGEQGLLSLAFHPKFSQNGYFYVNYVATNPRRTIIARYRVSPSNPDSALKNSELILLTFNQPYSNHNGGQLAFGEDGYLYIATGDGGSGGDPLNNGQNKTTLLGKILRIDVDNPSGGNNYGIPADNPFAGNTQGFAQEIYAYGLRNPWRFSFDNATGRLWCADVGQNLWEEVNIIEKGGNYGWRVMEGNACYNPSTGCDTSGLKLPVLVYGHNSAGGYSVTGGYVYRGKTVPQLAGKYIYADYVSKRVWALDYQGNGSFTNEVILNSSGISIAAFGVDYNKELYMLDLVGGKIYRFAEQVDIDDDAYKSPIALDESFVLNGNYPNPFNPETRISFSVYEEGEVKIRIFDLLGNEIAILENRSFTPGNYVTGWNASAFANGVYIARLEGISASTGRVYSNIKKLVLLK